MSWTLCIDFGTAFSKAAAAPSESWRNFNPALVRPLMLSADGGRAFMLDSAVFIDDRVLFGAAAIAREHALSNPKRMALRSFKTILGALDLERALENSAPRSIDPTGSFRMRDLIVLYFAFLTAAIERAIASDPMLAKVSGGFDLRYAAPVWRSGAGAGNHELIERLFAEADVVYELLGGDLLAAQGVTIDAAERALRAADKSESSPSEMGVIFEAVAAAAYTSIGLENPASHLIVVDMGAGTTDIAAVARSQTGLEELPGARVTLKEAGDFIDRVIANLALDQCKHLKTTAQQAALWRALMRSVRDIKESLFAEGQASFRFEGRLLKFDLRGLERAPDFRVFSENLEEAYAKALAAVCRAAAAQGAREIQSVAVGGGAGAPFVQALIRTKPRGKFKVTPRPATPAWAHAEEFQGNLAPVFAQLAIAIGGALAPDSMLAVRADSSPARTDKPQARD